MYVYVYVFPAHFLWYLPASSAVRYRQRLWASRTWRAFRIRRWASSAASSCSIWSSTACADWLPASGRLERWASVGERHASAEARLHATGVRVHESGRGRAVEHESAGASVNRDADGRVCERRDDPSTPMALADHCESERPGCAACRWLRQLDGESAGWRSWEASCRCWRSTDAWRQTDHSWPGRTAASRVRNAKAVKTLQINTKIH